VPALAMMLVPVTTIFVASLVVPATIGLGVVTIFVIVGTAGAVIVKLLGTDHVLFGVSLFTTTTFKIVVAVAGIQFAAIEPVS
jgi:hypothetical protein